MKNIENLWKTLNDIVHNVMKHVKETDVLWKNMKDLMQCVTKNVMYYYFW